MTHAEITRDDVIAEAWRIATARPTDAVRMASTPPQEWGSLDLSVLTKLELGKDGQIKMEFVDRGRLLERLMDVVAPASSYEAYQLLRQMAYGNDGGESL